MGQPGRVNKQTGGGFAIKNCSTFHSALGDLNVNIYRLAYRGGAGNRTRVLRN